ncbi:DUF2510 domain-containing protein [Pseudonocardia sp.]|uniref:DUF2510 domain-containing protein n=1 Tax=Pseudonocardia sp. TaxID=60912 RepID=UPI003D129C91
MGLIRKSLAVGTMGAVRGSSKKQRVAKAQLRELKAQTALQKEQMEAEEAAEERAQIRAVQEARAARAAAAAPFAPPAAGWFPHPDREDLMCWWDGQQWTDKTAPRG